MKYNIITTNQSFYNTGIYPSILKDYVVTSTKPFKFGEYHPYATVCINDILSLEVIK